MEKTKITTRQIEDIEHSFYCDECNKYLGTSKECDDGWYKEFGEFELNLYINTWYHIKKCLCNDCRNKFLTNLKTVLIDMGFKNNDE